MRLTINATETVGSVWTLDIKHCRQIKRGRGESQPGRRRAPPFDAPFGPGKRKGAVQGVIRQRVANQEHEKRIQPWEPLQRNRRGWASSQAGSIIAPMSCNNAPAVGSAGSRQ